MTLKSQDVLWDANTQKEHFFECSFVAEKVGFFASPAVCLRFAPRARSAALPGAGKPSAGRFAYSPFKSLDKIKRALFRMLFCGGEGGI